MTQEKFEKLVNEGIRAIPKKFLKKLNNVDIVIEEEPTSYQLRKLKARKHSIIFGLYEGVPQTKRWHYDQVLPDKITIFQKPIEKFAKSKKNSNPSAGRYEEIVKELVKNTVWHEIAHHFGMSEQKVRELERKRKAE